MNTLCHVLAPAKLNLFLHIVGRRPDGMHDLQSVFMLIDWCDVLHFESINAPTISREDLGTVLPTDDLCTRAARALQSASGHTGGVHIQIDKHIPAQAGMGGGSSDAASTLLALNRLWGLNWPLEALKPIALRLGADVPFFLSACSAWVEGVGEIITPLELPPAQFLILKPKAGLETGRIFQDDALVRNTDPATISGFAVQLFDFGRNDLQPVAQRLCPEVGEALDWLVTLGLKPRMTGSGSAVFAQWSPSKALPAAPHGWQMKVCSNLSAHPLAAWALKDS